MSNFYGEHNPAFRAPITDVVARFGLRLKRQGRELVGPCPVCGGRDGSLSPYGRKFGTVVVAFAVAMPSLSFDILKGAIREALGVLGGGDKRSRAPSADAERR